MPTRARAAITSAWTSLIPEMSGEAEDVVDAEVVDEGK